MFISVRTESLNEFSNSIPLSVNKKVKINKEIFPNTPPESFWTSEKNPWQPRFMWTVNFFTGYTFGRFPGFIPNYVRLVRDR